MMNQIKLFLLLSILFLITSCNKKTINNEKWNQVSLDPKIRENAIYKEMNKQSEIFFFAEERDSTLKRSSNVSYYSGTKLNLDNEYARNYTCKAYFLLSDTLTIKIGMESGFGGHGFKINVYRNKFHTQTFKTGDVINELEVLPTRKIIYQKLTLDKTNYIIGDSLFGHIEFKSIETDQDNNKIQHFGKGYFRTKIKEL